MLVETCLIPIFSFWSKADCSRVCPVSGTKIDLRENKEAIGQLASQGLSPVKREQGIKLANKIRAVKYMECSALTQRGLKQVCQHYHS